MLCVVSCGYRKLAAVTRCTALSVGRISVTCVGGSLEGVPSCWVTMPTGGVCVVVWLLSTLTTHGRESQAGSLCGVGYTLYNMLYIIHITFHIVPLLKRLLWM